MKPVTFEEMLERKLRQYKDALKEVQIQRRVDIAVYDVKVAIMRSEIDSINGYISSLKEVDKK